MNGTASNLKDGLKPSGTIQHGRHGKQPKLKQCLKGLYWSEEQENYVYNQYDEEHCKAYEYVNSSWSAWCASASREGYKLVPVEINNEIESAMFSSVARGEMPCDIYKAMIGAQENNG